MWLFRRRVDDVISNVESLRWGNAEARIRQKLEHASTAAERANLPEPGVDSIDDLEELLYHHRWSTSARGIVIDAWEGVADAIRKTATRAAVDVAGPRTEFSPDKTRLLLKGLAEQGVIEPGIETIVDALRAIRNEAAHGRDFRLGLPEALEYSKLARQVIGALLKTNLRTPPSRGDAAELTR